MRKTNSTLRLVLKQSQNNNISQLESSIGEAKTLSFCPDDPAFHFLPQMDRIMSTGYSPNNADILSIRIATTGIILILIDQT